MEFKVDKNWVHFISIAGVTTGPLAVEFKKQGKRVTGTDKILYDPIKSFLERNHIKIFREFSFKNLINAENKVPGLIVVGSGVSLKNKEFKFVKLHNLNYTHFPKVLNKYVVAKESIVVSGTFAKTTISSMLVSIFKNIDSNLSYMFGGQLVSFQDTLEFKDDKTKFSIIEGDEYISSRFDKVSKFFYYNPKYLILTSLNWDHTDIFKIHEEYIENFKKLIEKIPNTGFIFANGDDENILKLSKRVDKKFIFYSQKTLKKVQKELALKLQILGDFNLENALISASFARLFGIKDEIIKSSLEKFQGIKRRLEVKYKDENYIIIDDFASSPAKVQGSLKSLKKEFKNYKIIVIFEPNFGSRTIASLRNFKKVFKKDLLDLLVLPKFTEIKQKELSIDEHEFARIIKEKVKTIIVEDKRDLGKTLISMRKEKGEEKTVFAFLSSHQSDDLIDNLIQEIKDEKEA